MCLWDGRETETLYIVKDWPAREDVIPEKFNVNNTALVNLKKVLVPPPHIKLGLMTS
jgi:hypothetical protein